MSKKHQSSKFSQTDSNRPRKHTTSRRKLTWLWVSMALLAFALLGIIVFQPHSISPTVVSSSQAPAVVGITPVQAYTKIQQGAFVLDVRTQDEWNQYHLDGSSLIPLNELSNRVSEIPQDREIVVICRSGHRAQSAASTLTKAGFAHVSYLSGGLLAWSAAGYQGVGTAP